MPNLSTRLSLDASTFASGITAAGHMADQFGAKLANISRRASEDALDAVRNSPAARSMLQGLGQMDKLKTAPSQTEFIDANTAARLQNMERGFSQLGGTAGSFTTKLKQSSGATKQLITTFGILGATGQLSLRGIVSQALLMGSTIKAAGLAGGLAFGGVAGAAYFAHNRIKEVIKRTKEADELWESIGKKAPGFWGNLAIGTGFSNAPFVSGFNTAEDKKSAAQRFNLFQTKEFQKSQEPKTTEDLFADWLAGLDRVASKTEQMAKFNELTAAKEKRDREERFAAAAQANAREDDDALIRKMREDEEAKNKLAEKLAPQAKFGPGSMLDFDRLQRIGGFTGADNIMKSQQSNMHRAQGQFAYSSGPIEVRVIQAVPMTFAPFTGSGLPVEIVKTRVSPPPIVN